MIDPVALANAFVDVAVALIVLGLRRWKGAVGLLRLAVAASVVVASIAAKLLILVPGVRYGWGVINVLWYDLLIVVPVVGLWLVTRRRGRVTPSVRVLGVLGVLFLPLLGYANLVAPFDLRLETVDVRLADERAGTDTVRVAVLADLQTSSAVAHEQNAIDMIVAENPDVVLVPGDIYQGPDDRFAERLPGLKALFERLTAVAPVVLVEGDCDTPAELRALIEGTAVRWLSDEVVTLRVHDREVTILGLPNECIQAESAAAVRAFEAATGVADLRILVAHKPVAVELLSEASRVDLLVAGHTHGGQVVIPGFGPPLTFSAVPRAVAAGGLHDMQGRRLYVSRGVGHEQPPAPRIRLFCPPEVTLLLIGDPVAKRP